MFNMLRQDSKRFHNIENLNEVSLEQSESDVGAKRGKTRVNYLMIALIGQKRKTG